MNNIVEYEALVSGLQKAIKLNVSMLKVVGDSEILVRQVCNTIHCVSPCLKSYQKEVWRFISQFQAFNIIFVPRVRNVVADSLENVAARMIPLRDRFSTEI